jgi:hypothetical protein
MRRRCRNINIKIGMKTWSAWKRSYKKKYKNKFTTRNNDRCNWRGIGKEIKVF